MANASLDKNNVPTLIAVKNSDGATILRVKANPANHALKISDGNTGSDNGPTPARALHDQNNRPTLLAVSSVDGVSIVPVYTDSSGNLLVQST